MIYKYNERKCVKGIFGFILSLTQKKHLPLRQMLSVLFCFGMLSQLCVNIPSAVHDADNTYRFVLCIGDIEYKVVIHRHDPQTTTSPWFFVIQTESSGHGVQTENILFQSVKLTFCNLYGFQFVCNILKYATKIICRLLGHNNLEAHTP